MQSKTNTTNEPVNNIQENSTSEITNSNSIDIANNTNSAPNNSDTNIVTENNYQVISEKFGEDDIFVITDVSKENAESYTLKGVIYTKLTMTKNELEELAKKGTFKYHSFSYDDPDYEYTVKKNYSDMGFNTDYAFLYKWENEERLGFYASKKDENTYYIKSSSQFPDEWTSTKQYKQITVSANTVVETDYDNSTVEKAFKDFKSPDLSSIGRITNGYRFEFENGKCTKVIEELLGGL